MATFSKPPRKREPDKTEPKFEYNLKLIIISIIIEVLVGAASMAGSAIFAAEYGHDLPTRIMIMLPAVIYAAFEIARVPLAIVARTHVSVLMQVLAVVGIFLICGFTAKNVSQLTDQGYEPRLSEARAARATLDDALQNKAAFDAQVQLAKEEVEKDKSVLEGAQARLQSGSRDLGQLSSCGKNCNKDATASLMRVNLRAATSAVAVAKHDLDAASLRLSRLDPSKAVQAVRAATVAFREAINGSQLHLFASSLLGVEPGKLTDDQMAWVKRVLVIAPAVLASFMASLLAILAISPIQRQPIVSDTIELPDESALILLKPMTDTIAQVAQSITDETIIDLTKERAKREAARKDEPADTPDGAAPAKPLNDEAEAVAPAAAPAPEADATPPADLPEPAPPSLPPETPEAAEATPGARAESTPTAPNRERKKPRASPAKPPSRLQPPKNGGLADGR